MLRKDTNAGFEKSGIGPFSRYRFVSGRIEVRSALGSAAYARLLRDQVETPVQVMADSESRRCWWMFRDEFFWEDEALDTIEVKALLLERQTQRERRVKRAVALMEQGESITGAAREVIADDVKTFVWNRDGGRCVRCGSRQRLEFDHVIPVTLGGSNTARNLQLLCETCNRSKGASLT